MAAVKLPRHGSLQAIHAATQRRSSQYARARYLAESRYRAVRSSERAFHRDRGWYGLQLRSFSITDLHQEQLVPTAIHDSQWRPKTSVLS